MVMAAMARMARETPTPMPARALGGRLEGQWVHVVGEVELEPGVGDRVVVGGWGGGEVVGGVGRLLEMCWVWMLGLGLWLMRSRAG